MAGMVLRKMGGRGPVPMGMDKKTLQELPANTTVTLSGWVLRPGFPDTVIENDRLVPGFDGTILVNGRAAITGAMGFFETAIVVDIMKNNTVIRTGNISGNQANAVTLSPIQTTITATDTIWMRARGSGSPNQLSGLDSSTGRAVYLHFSVVS